MSAKLIATCLLLPALFLTAAGCGNTQPVAEAQPVSAAPSQNFVLPSEPPGALGVIAAREKAQDDQPLVIVGRVGGGIKPWIEPEVKNPGPA